MVKTLQRHGNSHALVIEKPLMEALGITEKTPLQIHVDGANLIVTPVGVGFGPAQVKQSVARMRKRYGTTLKRLAE